MKFRKIVKGILLIAGFLTDIKPHVEKGLELITIRYYNQQTIDRVLVNKEIIRELKDQYTCQILVKDLNE